MHPEFTEKFIDLLEAKFQLSAKSPPAAPSIDMLPQSKAIMA
jgi:hypothetical protein